MAKQNNERIRRILPTHKEVKETLASPSMSTLREVRKMFDQYADEVDRSDLSQSSKAMYIDFANCFVRWIYGGFKPGMRNPDKPHSNIVR